MRQELAFSNTERLFLESQFGRAEVTLLQRSSRPPELCLIAWTGRRVSRSTPVFGMRGPRQAWYVLDMRSVPELSAVGSWNHIDGRWPGAFTPVEPPRSAWWEQIADGLRRPRAWHIVAVLVVWLVLAILATAWVVSGHRL